MDKPTLYRYGQGRISIAYRDPVTGLPGKFKWVGDVSALSVKLSVAKVTHNESFTGQQAETASFPTKKTSTLDMTINQVDIDTLALALFGTPVTTAAGTVTGELLDATLVANDVFYLANPGVSEVVITDSTSGAAKTLVAGTDYSLDDANFGRCTLLNVTGFVMPLKAAYSYGARKAVGIFTAKQPNIALRYEGVNLANDGAPEMVDLYKVATDPLAELALISTGNDVEGMLITGGVLIDPSKPATGGLGQFGSITQISPAAG
ncbi:hypothetical protein [Dyella sp.]|uniref:phage tail tube protein n=1 Tax=Dyella sp. TaxID=1869338 RepID=UPI002844AD80|nr:hypothetical protein [Dyella sp.]MDR3444699.1 hypothetical protein [Dyella sp.]